LTGFIVFSGLNAIVGAIKSWSTVVQVGDVSSRNDIEKNLLTAQRTRIVQPQKKFHMLFSAVMGAMMISVMTFVITWVNVGLGPQFPGAWMKAFVIAYVIGVPVIYFLAPVARKITGRILGMQP
jgi:hypothetical protein